jgi:ABC-2 type transport system permease protein
VLGLGQTAGALAVATALSTVALGIRTLGLAGSLWTVGALLVSPLVFLAVAAVASQIGGTRAQAVRLAAAVLGAAYLLRVVATAVDGWDALAWASPLGWVDRAAPLTEPTVLPLLVAAAATIVLAGVAVEMSARRDVGAGLWSERPPRRSRTRLLTGSTGLSVRLARPAAVAWLAGMAVLGGVLGTVARTASEALQDSVLDDGLGGSLAEAHLAGGTTSFLGASFLVVALLLSLLAAGQAAAARDEEASGRLDTLLSAPVGRVAWLGGRAIVAGVLLALAAGSAALAAWAGSAATGGETTTADMLAAAATVVPGALVVLGLGVLVLGVAPRYTAPLAYGYVAAAFLLEILGSVLDVPEPVLAVSVFHHLPPVPAAEAEPVTAAVMVALALVLTAVAAVALRRRDLTGP